MVSIARARASKSTCAVMSARPARQWVGEGVPADGLQRFAEALFGMAVVDEECDAAASRTRRPSSIATVSGRHS